VQVLNIEPSCAVNMGGLLDVSGSQAGTENSSHRDLVKIDATEDCNLIGTERFLKAAVLVRVHRVARIRPVKKLP
jgi:hypothetical protein